MPATRQRTASRKRNLRNGALLAVSEAAKLVSIPLAQDVARHIKQVVVVLKPSVLQAPRINDSSVRDLAKHVEGLIEVLNRAVQQLDSSGLATATSNEDIMVGLRQLQTHLSNTFTEFQGLQQPSYVTKLASQDEIRERTLQLKEQLSSTINDLTLRLLVAVLAFGTQGQLVTVRRLDSTAREYNSLTRKHNALKEHKTVHTKGNGSSGALFNPFYYYAFTGSLRPVYPLSPRRIVPPEIPRPDYAEDGIPHSERLREALTIKILTPEEQECMRTVCRLAREVLDIAAAAVRPGITTDEIDAIVHEETIKRGSYPSPLNYREFPKSVCTSINEVICHGIPDQRKLEEGDIINLDVSLYHNGFHADLNETYPVGKISEESQKLIRTTRKCLDAAIAICKPGTLFRDIGKVIEPIARGQGCSVVRNYTAHGVGHLFHGAPNNIPHYAKNKMTGMMKPGMCFTIEPMINLGPSWETEHWPDNWTAVTIDGKRSAQFEETLLITETGVEVLTAGKPREDLL